MHEAFVWIAFVKLLLACGALLICAACNTLENRRDLYSHDTPFYYERPAAPTVRQTTTTTTTSGPVEFRPRADSDELPETSGD